MSRPRVFLAAGACIAAVAALIFVLLAYTPLFRALRGSGIRQVIFAAVMCVLCFAVTAGVALLFGYNPGEAAGLFAVSKIQSIWVITRKSETSDSGEAL